MDASLTRAHDLMLVHPVLMVMYRLVGELQYAAAVCAAYGNGSSEDHLSAVVLHVRVTLEVLTAARRLAPDCIDILPPFSSPAVGAGSGAASGWDGGAARRWGPAETRLMAAGA
jgi:hypothetical protein